MIKKFLKYVTIFLIMLTCIFSINISRAYATVTTAQNLIYDDPDYLERSNYYLKEILVHS